MRGWGKSLGVSQITHTRARTHTHTKASAHAAVPGAAVQIDEVLTGAAAVTFAAAQQVTPGALGL